MFFKATMSVSLEQLCSMVNLSYDEAKSLFRESESSNGESSERETSVEARELFELNVHIGIMN